MSPTDLVTSPFLVAAGLLVMSGVTKVARPDPTIRALESAGLPSGRGKVRVFAAVEAAVGAACLAAPRPLPAATLAVLYALFGAFLLRLVRRGSSASCGCVGGRDAPPSLVHVGLDLLAAASGVVVAVAGAPTAREVITEGPFLGIPTAAGLVAAGYLAYACAVYLPRAWNSYRPHGGHEDRVHSRPAPAFQLSLGTRP